MTREKRIAGLLRQDANLENDIATTLRFTMTSLNPEYDKGPATQQAGNPTVYIYHAGPNIARIEHKRTSKSNAYLSDLYIHVEGKDAVKLRSEIAKNLLELMNKHSA